MEVHSHAHSPTATHKKKWTHYIWEFLMLFLAVFCGFLAENTREHIMEHKRAKIYATNLYEELKTDTAYLNYLIPWTDTLVKKFDTLSMITKSDTSVTTGKLYFFAGYTGWIKYFNSQTSTIEQLKNSGNQRIMKQEIALRLSDYERSLKGIEKDYDMFRIEYETMIALRMKIFDGPLLNELFHSRNPKLRDSVYLINPPLLNNDPKMMREFIGWATSEAIFWRDNVRYYLIPIKEDALEIIQMLEKEYHIK